jgi:hypothetical protein
MIYADLEKLDLPETLRARLEQATARLLAMQDENQRKDFIEANSGLWREVRPALAKICGRNENDCKCWYCESKGPGFTHHVDHFRPKLRVKNTREPEEPGYWWLAFECGNLRLSCQRCNTGGGKRDQFPLAPSSPRITEPSEDLEQESRLLLDPTRAVEPSMLAYSEDGLVYPRYSEEGPGTMAETSIRVYDLNHVSKVEARKAVWLDCCELASRARSALVQLVQGPAEARRVAKDRFKDTCHDIQKKVSPSAEYSAMARYCFQGMAENWILDLMSAGLDAA